MLEDFEYEKLRGRLGEERHLLRILRSRRRTPTSSPWRCSSPAPAPGEPQVTQLRGRVTPAVIVEKVNGPGQFPLLLLTDENLWLLVPADGGRPPRRAGLSAGGHVMVPDLQQGIGCAMGISRAEDWPWPWLTWPAAMT